MQASLHKCIGALKSYAEGSVLPNHGTGFLISANIVLTCAHVLWDRSKQQLNKDIMFFPGIHGETGDAEAYQIEVKGGELTVYVPDEYKSGKEGYDYAFVKLGKNV